MKTQEVPANIRFAARLVAGAIRRIKSQQPSTQKSKITAREPDGINCPSPRGGF